MICLNIKSRLFWTIFWNFWLPRFVLGCFLFRGMLRNGIPKVCFFFLFHGMEFLVVFSSTEWFGTEFREFASISVPRNGIPSCFLFRRRIGTEFWQFASFFSQNWIPSCFLFGRSGVRNGIMRVCFYFFSMERNSELFSLPRKGSERNSKSFLSRGTAGIPLEMTICSVYFVFRGLNFLSEIPNLKYQSVRKMSLILCSIELRLQMRFSMDWKILPYRYADMT